MARLSIVCALAAVVVVLAAFSAHALKTNKFHVSGAAPFRRIHFVNRHFPPSTIRRKHAGHHTVSTLPAGGRKNTPQAAAPSPVVYQDYALPPEPFQGFHNCLEKLRKVAKLDKKKIQARDIEIWSNCVLITNHKGKSSSPILP